MRAQGHHVVGDIGAEHDQAALGHEFVVGLLDRLEIAVRQSEDLALDQLDRPIDQPRLSGLSERQGRQATTRGSARSARAGRFVVWAITSASSLRLGPSGIAGRQPPA